MRIQTKLSKRSNFTNIVFREEYKNKEREYRNILNSIVTAFNKVEYLSVVERVRDAHLTFINPEDLEAKRKYFDRYGLKIVTLNKEGRQGGGYGNHSMPYTGGDNFSYRSIVTRPELVDEWESIWRKRSEDIPHGEFLIGRGLGYPKCCSAFFKQIWIENGGIDTTWQQAVCTFENTEDYNSVSDKYRYSFDIVLSKDIPVGASNLLRWAGPRLVSHLPCSFLCQQSVDIAENNMGVAKAHGFGTEYDHLENMLKWDTTWTAHMGIAKIETPVFTIVTATDITENTYSVRKIGHTNSII
jgi:hypothetical protein